MKFPGESFSRQSRTRSSRKQNSIRVVRSSRHKTILQNWVYQTVDQQGKCQLNQLNGSRIVWNATANVISQQYLESKTSPIYIYHHLRQEHSNTKILPATAAMHPPHDSQPSTVSDYDSVAVLLLFVLFHVFGGFVLVSESEEDGGC